MSPSALVRPLAFPFCDFVFHNPSVKLKAPSRIMPSV
jgi:hypothetical protein